MRTKSIKMRYFASLAYQGTSYSGWQRQPNASSIQQEIEEAFSLILRTNIAVVGCGRTDAGVHASQFYLHFDYEGEFPKSFLPRVNKVLSRDIVIYELIEVPQEQHARFDATQRAYEYHITFDKNPFKKEYAFFYAYAENLDIHKMQEAANLLMEYEAFFPFCKTNTDVKTMICDLKRAEWKMQEDGRGITLFIAANRFLRGMVRLIVGMSINVGLGKLEIAAVKKAMDEQIFLEKAYSVPAEGLFLTEVKYPFLDEKNR